MYKSISREKLIESNNGKMTKLRVIKRLSKRLNAHKSSQDLHNIILLWIYRHLRFLRVLSRATRIGYYIRVVKYVSVWSFIWNVNGKCPLKSDLGQHCWFEGGSDKVYSDGLCSGQIGYFFLQYVEQFEINMFILSHKHKLEWNVITRSTITIVRVPCVDARRNVDFSIWFSARNVDMR